MKPASKSIQISQSSKSSFWFLFDFVPLGQGIHLCSYLTNLCFHSVPFMVHGFSKSSSEWKYRCLSWWSIQDTALFLLSLSTLSQKVTFAYTQVKDIARSEVANKSRIALVQKAAKPVENSSEDWCQEIHSLTSNQTPQLLRAMIIEIHPTPRLLIRSLTAQVSPTCKQVTKQSRLVLIL